MRREKAILERELGALYRFRYWRSQFVISKPVLYEDPVFQDLPNYSSFGGDRVLILSKLTLHASHDVQEGPDHTQVERDHT